MARPQCACVRAWFIAARRGMAKSRRRNKLDAKQQVCRNIGDNIAWLGLPILENVFVSQHRQSTKFDFVLAVSAAYSHSDTFWQSLLRTFWLRCYVTLHEQGRIAMDGRLADFGRKNEPTQSQGQKVDVESDIVEYVDESGGDRENGWTRDFSSILLLLVLYTLQGIPMGLSGSMPFLLQEKVTAPGSLISRIIGRTNGCP